MPASPSTSFRVYLLGVLTSIFLIALIAVVAPAGAGAKTTDKAGAGQKRDPALRYFKGAHLKAADLRDAYIEDSNFTGVRFIGTSLREGRQEGCRSGQGHPKRV